MTDRKRRATTGLSRRRQMDGKPAPREIAGPRLRRALDHLSAADPDMARAIALLGAPPPRARPPGFGALLDIIIAQQVSTASARAIRQRLAAAASPLSAEAFLALDDAALRRIGFSRRKVVYARGVAAALTAGELDLEGLAQRSDEEAIAELVTLRGIGRWSAEVYLLFSLQRPDVLPADDLALLTAAQRLKRLAARPTPAELRAMAEPWRPWRSVAARLLWHWYREAPIDA